MRKVIIKEIQFFCWHCGHECIIQWISYIKGELPVGPSYCPWCGTKHEGEIQWDDDKEEKKE